MFVVIFLGAIVLANLAIALLGPGAAPIIAFLLIGLDLSLRDKLHDTWRGQHLPLRMGVLIATGSVLSYALNRSAGQVAVASFIAFAAAASADALVFGLLRRRGWLTAANGSNVVGAAVDSTLFPLLAFGAFLPWVMLGQFVAKSLGGACWAAVLARVRQRTVPA